MPPQHKEITITIKYYAVGYRALCQAPGCKFESWQYTHKRRAVMSGLSHQKKKHPNAIVLFRES